MKGIIKAAYSLKGRRTDLRSASNNGGKADIAGFPRWPRFRRFDLTEHQNRLDGSPWSESGKPARHIGAKAFILGSEALAEGGLLIGNYDNVKKEPEQRAVAEEMPLSE